MIYQVPPHSLEAERSLLGICLIEKGTFDKALFLLEGTDFYREAHRVIWETLLSLSIRKISIDIFLVKEHLGDMLEKVGGLSYLMELANSPPNSGNLERYAEIIKTKSLSRRKIQLAEEDIRKLYDGEEPAMVVSQSMIADMDLLNGRQKNEIVPVGKLVQGVFDQIDASINLDGITGIPSGFHGLDHISGGLQVGMILLAARPSMGKTTFALNIARNVARKGQEVLIFSLEMTKKQLTRKFLSMESRINSKLFNNASKINEYQWSKLSEAAGIIHELGIFIDDTSGIKASEILIMARQFKSLHPNLGLVIIDYIGLINPENRQGNQNEKLTEISRILKSLPKEVDAPLVALSQLSRDVEKRGEKIPILSDLRDSGSLEQDADMIMFLYREDYYEPKENGCPDPSETDLIIAKNRGDGGVGLIKLNYYKAFQHFESLERQKTN